MPRSAKSQAEAAVTLQSTDDTQVSFDRSDPTVHFSLPRHLTVRQQLEYYSRYADTRSEPLYLRLWYSAQSVIGDWTCDVLPDPHVPLDQLTNPQAATAIMWAGQLVLGYMDSLESVPKA